jgi:hypothetical protein
MEVIKQTDWNAGHGRILCPSHVDGRATSRAEELTEHAAKVGGPIKLYSFALDQKLFVRPIRGFPKG